MDDTGGQYTPAAEICARRRIQHGGQSDGGCLDPNSVISICQALHMAENQPLLPSSANQSDHPSRRKRTAEFLETPLLHKFVIFLVGIKPPRFRETLIVTP
jgi:hypothetical protein